MVAHRDQAHITVMFKEVFLSLFGELDQLESVELADEA